MHRGGTAPLLVGMTATPIGHSPMAPRQWRRTSASTHCLRPKAVFVMEKHASAVKAKHLPKVGRVKPVRSFKVPGGRSLSAG